MRSVCVRVAWPTANRIQSIAFQQIVKKIVKKCNKPIFNSNQVHNIFPRFPTPDSRFPIPDSRFPTPYSLLPTPYSLLPTPYSLLPTPYSLLPTPYSLP
ncbi:MULTISPECIES: hypothetical protein [unclassified Moorena]|uniref:hypothetical protein n=1 Tax=unclassified Moorena TaxID=2683338 RepID=UPI0013C9F035|nr:MULTISPECIES: hypothetical protein [unclassified Moorena]NEO20697.1 hypothetical protein [Moorena sp. SIO4A5]NEQ61485.1 hypothetical protein [Moorena sp. SIO4A1]